MSFQKSPKTPSKLTPTSPSKNHCNYFNFQDSGIESPPISPVNKTSTHQIQETTDVDRNRNKFGPKASYIRRMSSTEWESPYNNEDNKLAQVTDNENIFQANIDLNAFPNFELDEIDVDVYGYDVLVHARKDNPNNPNMALSEFSRQYRLPDDIDLESVKLNKNFQKRRVSVKADKLKNMGKPLSYHVYDVTNHNPDIKLI